MDSLALVCFRIPSIAHVLLRVLLASDSVIIEEHLSGECSVPRDLHAVDPGATFVEFIRFRRWVHLKWLFFQSSLWSVLGGLYVTFF
jgi:hypothetical protein